MRNAKPKELKGWQKAAQICTVAIICGVILLAIVFSFFWTDRPQWTNWVVVAGFVLLIGFWVIIGIALLIMKLRRTRREE